MRHSSLVSFLCGERPAEELWREIETEVKDCLAACSKGGAGHVIITDGPETQIKRQHANVLLAALADGGLPLSAASYIADALIMSDDFDWNDEVVAEALLVLSDESVPLTLAEIEQARNRLST